VNRHEKRKALKLTKMAPPSKERTHFIGDQPLFVLSDEEMEQVMPYQNSRHQDIPLEILHLMYKGSRDVNPYFALQVYDWIMLRDPS